MKDPEMLVTAPKVSSEGLAATIEGWAGGLRRCHALKAATEMSLFRHTGKPVTAEDLAGRLGSDPVMTAMLCDCLADMGLLVASEDGYRSTVEAGTYLNPDSPRYQGTVLTNIFDRMDTWTRLSTIVHDGPEKASAEEVYGDRWLSSIAESSLGGGIARTVSAVESAVDLPREGTFLDLGGGHGLYTIAFLHRHPGLKGYLFDRPTMAPMAERTFAEYGCDAVTVPGDFYEDDLGGPYDVVFSSFNHSVSDCSLCDRVFSSVKSGGLLILRRHLRLAQPDPLRVMEWNLRIRDGDEKGGIRYCGSWLPTSEEYLERMRGLGMSLVHRGDLGDDSEIVVMRRETE